MHVPIDAVRDDLKAAAALAAVALVIVGLSYTAWTFPSVVGGYFDAAGAEMAAACVEGCRVGTGPNYGSVGVALTIPAAVVATYTVWRAQ